MKGHTNLDLNEHNKNLIDNIFHIYFKFFSTLRVRNIFVQVKYLCSIPPSELTISQYEIKHFELQKNAQNNPLEVLPRNPITFVVFLCKLDSGY